MRERAHIARPLHVVLPAQRIHARATPADVTGQHRQIRHADHRGRALAMLRHAQPVIDRRVRSLRIQPRRRAKLRARECP